MERAVIEQLGSRGRTGSQDFARQYERMARLAELDLHGDSLEEVLQRIAEVAAELLPADRGASVLLWDARREAFTLAVSTIAGQDPRDVVARVRSEGGASRFVVEHLDQVAVHDIDHDPFGANRLNEDFGVGAYAATPIVLEGRPVGVLYALEPEPRHWSRDDLAFLRTLAERAAAAIERARLAQEAAYQRERAEVLAFVANSLIGVASLEETLQTIVDAILAGMAADAVELRLLDGQRSGLVIVGPEPIRDPRQVELLAAARARAMDARFGLVLPGEEAAAEIGAPVGSAVIAPLWSRGKTIGFLAALRGLDVEDFDGDDAALMSALANQAVVSIENARLFEETEEALMELSAVYEIVQAQNREVGLEQMLKAIAEVVASALPALRVSIGVLDDEDFEIRHVVTGGQSRGIDPSRLMELLDGIVEGGIPPTTVPVPATEDDGPRLVVPLVHRSRNVALLVAEREPEAPPFGAHETEMASVMGAQVAVAIANSLLIEETHRLALTDALTGINNRRHLFELGVRSFAAAKRYGRPLSAVMFDIDHFKQINDTYGHAVGDEVLVEVAERARRTVRDVDVLGRYGGEEFVALLPETDLERGTTAAERLRRAIGDTPIETSAGPLEVTVSAGVAQVAPDMDDLADLIDCADQALYAAKHGGRNQVRAFAEAIARP